MITFDLLDYEGHIAVASEWHANWQEPRQSRTVWVFPDRAENYGDLEKFEYQGYQGNYVGFYNTISWKYIHFLCDDTARVVFEQRPVKAPGRGGKDWQWKWIDGKWARDYGHGAR